MLGLSDDGNQGATTYSDERGECKYQEGIRLMQQGEFERAIMAFGKASFFSPNKPHPFIASAECYVSLYDLQGAVKQYRRSLWLLRQQEGGAGSPVSTPRRSVYRASVPDVCRGSPRGSDAGSHALERTTSNVSREGLLSKCVGATSSTASNLVPSCSNGLGDRMLEEAVRERLAGILDALSIVLFNVRDYEQALRFADESLTLCPNPQVVLHRCTYLIALERCEEAEKVLERHAANHPYFLAHSCSLLVHVYCLRQSFLRAKGMLEKIPQSDRPNPQLLLAQHIFNRTYQAFRTASVQQADFQALCRCLAVYPSDPLLLLERAKYYISKGMDKKAVTDLFHCISVTEGCHEVAIDLMTSTLFRLGLSVDGHATTANAIEYYTTSLMWRQDNIPVLLARGECYVKVRDYQKALLDFLTVDRISPKHPDATRWIAKLHDLHGCELHEKGKFAEAEREFSHAIAVWSTEPVFFYHRARCRFDMDQPRYALRDVLSCHNLSPTDANIREFVLAHLSAVEKGPASLEAQGPCLPSVLRPGWCPSVSGQHGGGGWIKEAPRNREGRRRRGAGDRPAMAETDSVLGGLGGALTCSRAQLARREGKK